MNTLIKWPGGKAGEIGHIEHLIPPFRRYIEPFFGGGALLFHLEPDAAAVNDISRALMDFYGLVKEQDGLFHELLTAYDESFSGLLRACVRRMGELQAVYGDYCRTADTHILTENTAALAGSLAGELRGGAARLVRDWDGFTAALARSAADRMRRLAVNSRRKPFSEEDLAANLTTGFAGGYYTYFRSVYNGIELGRVTEPVQYRTANFYFIREYCYGSMFRYNGGGEFNIPYGGMSYNQKNFTAKIEKMFGGEAARVLRSAELYCGDFERFLNDVNLREDDFVFLDPPYDTDFSDYEGKAFTRADQERLAAYLRNMPARFILVIKNTEFIHGLYEGRFRIIPFDNRYTYNVRSRNERRVEHLIITNVPAAG